MAELKSIINDARMSRLGWLRVGAQLIRSVIIPSLTYSADVWLAARGLALEPAERDTLIEVRAALQAVVRDGASPELLAPFLSGVDLRPLVDDSGVTWQVSGADTAARMALAWDGLRISHPGRLRPCANTACHLFLLDRSRPNNARWCSMAVCGNRMKARRHYQRTRG